MITHYADLRLRTPSVEAARQVYADRLGLPVVDRSAGRIAVRLASHTTLVFEEADEPVAPAHLAFEVPHAAFDEAARVVREAGLLVLRLADGREVYEWDQSSGRAGAVSLYFRDGDGHLLELIAHPYVPAGVLPPEGPLRVLYLREVGFPVPSVPSFRAWLKETLGMRTGAEGDDFTFVVGGTAHAVVVARTRPWIPIQMRALPPKMRVTFGTPDAAFLDGARGVLRAAGEPLEDAGDEVGFAREGYALALRRTTDMPADLPARLNLPLSRNA